MPYDYSKDQLHRMVNNPYLADVKFLVGRKRKLIYAHRMLLTCASEVFSATFNKRFIHIHRNYPLMMVYDIEPEHFLDMLYFIYCDICDISKENVVQLFYAATKYKLYGLLERCEEFLTENTALSEWIEMFFDEAYSHLRNICARQLCANTEAVLRDPAFLRLGSAQVRDILDLRTHQCSNRQLLEGIDRWMEHQPESQREEIVGLRLNLVRRVREEESDRPVQCRLPYVSGMILASRPLSLYGIGIYTGIQERLAHIQCDATVIIEIGCCEEAVVNRSIPLALTNQKDGENPIQDFHFKRIQMSQGEAIKITVRIAGLDAGLCLAWCISNNDSSARICGDLRVVSTDDARFVSPIAYLLYE